jgi:hypothetical protein
VCSSDLVVVDIELMQVDTNKLREVGMSISPRQIGGGFSVFGRQLKGLHEEFWISILNCFVTDILHIGESAEMHYR